MRTTTKVMLAGAATFLLLVAGGAAWIYVQFDGAFQPNPPDVALPILVRNLPGPLITDAKKAFRVRVRAKFANGIVSDVLAAELQREGFTLGSTQQKFDAPLVSPPQYFAFVEQHGGMCLSDWSIWWRRDAQGRAQDIDGRYRYDCP